MMGSLMPTMSARSVTGNPQILYGGSAGNLDSAVWRQVRDRGRAGGDPTLVWIEWCAARVACANERCTHLYGTVGCQLDVQENWGAANPAMGRRISVEWIYGERRAMTADEFARERLGWWEDPEETVGGLPLEVWSVCADPKSELDEVECWAVALATHSTVWRAPCSVTDSSTRGSVFAARSRICSRGSHVRRPQLSGRWARSVW